ncbi:MAG TPA: hypothetical protein VJK52_06020 [Candidatus Nanoarchaeia archaeon]|nr:hypothetical protein [Candidatus Nanoarchaeia archaeon]
MTLDRFLQEKSRQYANTNVQAALHTIVLRTGVPVLTLRQITALARALGFEFHRERHHKHLSRPKYHAVVILAPDVASDPTVKSLSISRVYAAKPALEYLLAFALQANPNLSDEERQQFVPAVYFENAAHNL